MVCRPAISSHSLGRAWVHDLAPKLDQAALHGFDIELFYEDLLYVAKSMEGGPTPSNLLQAAVDVRRMCDEREISIVCLQPFMHYEGLRDRTAHRRRVEEMSLWLQLAKALGTSIISIPSTCLPEDEASGDINLIVQDMREVADLAAPEGVTIAYESLAWGTWADTWDHAWEVVKRVDRSNFGICLDTYNIAGRVYADPAAPLRKVPNAADAMQASIRRMVETIDVKKIVYVQVVDAQYLEEPLTKDHQLYQADQPARMSWSRNCRLFYGEHERGGYLPIKDILAAILNNIGFDGWISAELFNASLTDSDPRVPQQHAQRAADSWRKIVEDFQLDRKFQSRRSASSGATSASRSRAQL